MAKRKTKTRSRKPRLMDTWQPTPEEMTAIRRLIRERPWDQTVINPDDEDDLDFNEESALAHATWESELRERIGKIETCIKRGRHVTARSEGKLLQNNRSLVTLSCACGAYRRVSISINDKPPTEWT